MFPSNSYSRGAQLARTRTAIASSAMTALKMSCTCESIATCLDPVLSGVVGGCAFNLLCSGCSGGKGALAGDPRLQRGVRCFDVEMSIRRKRCSDDCNETDLGQHGSCKAGLALVALRE